MANAQLETNTNILYIYTHIYVIKTGAAETRRIHLYGIVIYFSFLIQLDWALLPSAKLLTLYPVCSDSTRALRSTDHLHEAASSYFSLFLFALLPLLSISLFLFLLLVYAHTVQLEYQD